MINPILLKGTPACDWIANKGGRGESREPDNPENESWFMSHDFPNSRDPCPHGCLK